MAIQDTNAASSVHADEFCLKRSRAVHLVTKQRAREAGVLGLADGDAGLRQATGRELPIRRSPKVPG